MKTKEELEKLIEKMYNLNRHISFNFIALGSKKSVPEKDAVIRDINLNIGEWIKTLREINEKFI